MYSKISHIIFIAEHNELVRQSLVALFSASGFEVAAFSSGSGLMEAIEQLTPDGAIIDMELPDMTGLDLLDGLRASDPEIPVVMIGGFVEVPLVVKAIQHGAIDVIEKPFRPDTLLGHFRKAPVQRRPKTLRVSKKYSDILQFDTLTTRQRQVLSHLIAGQQNKNIAFDLGISVRTVEVHRARMMKHLGVKNLTELLKLAIDAGATKH